MTPVSRPPLLTSESVARLSRSGNSTRLAQPRWFRRLVTLLVLASMGTAAANTVLLTRGFGEAPDGVDTRNLRELSVNLLSARRAPDIIAGVGGDRVLDARMAELFLNERMGTAASSSCIVVRQDGRTVLARNPNLAVLPASTMKLILASTVLTELDPNSRFVTEAKAATQPVNGVLSGDLYFVGGGDPLLATENYLSTFVRQPQIATPLEQLVDDIVKTGVKEINGSVVGHDRRYDDLRSVPSWKPSYLTQGEVGPISALSVNDSFIVTTASTRRRTRQPVWKAAEDPPSQAAAVLTSMLKARGIKIAGEPRTAEPTESVPSEILATLSSPALGEIVGQMLSESDNNTAESLLKELAYSKKELGTTADGIEVMKESLQKRGYPIGDLTLVDGSGLDRSNRVTCSVLIGAVEESISQIRKLLPVSGTSGTLSARMKGPEVLGKVRAKTGSLNGVSALAGEVDLLDGRTLNFAMVLNELPDGSPGVATGDEVAIALSRYPQVAPKTAKNAAGREPLTATAEVKEMEPYAYRAPKNPAVLALPKGDTTSGTPTGASTTVAGGTAGAAGAVVPASTSVPAP